MARSLLLAEDSTTLQKAVALSLGHEQYEITNVSNADDCITKAKTLRPDVVLIDHALGSGGATRVLEALRQDEASKDAKLVVLSGSSEPFDEAKARQAGADEIIAKPFDSQVLIDKLNALFGAVVDRGGEATRVAAPPASRPAGQPLTMNAPWPGFGKGGPAPGGPTTMPSMPASPATTPSMPASASAPQAAASPPWAPPRPATGGPATATPPAAAAAPAKAPSAPSPAPFAPPAAVAPAPVAAPIVAAPKPAPFGAPPTLGGPIVGAQPMGPTQTLAAFPALGRMGGATASSPTLPAMPAAGGPAPIARAPEAKVAPAPWAAPPAAAQAAAAAPATPSVAAMPAFAVAPIARPAISAAPVASAATTEGFVRAYLMEHPAVLGDIVRAYLNENRAVVEEAVWEIVPDLAETLIREEIARLLREKPAGK